jgi:hypothetical protein
MPFTPPLLRVHYVAEGLPYGIVSRSATQSKDMIFGVYVVVLQLTNNSLTPPDYSRTVGELYRELTLQLIIAYGLPVLIIAAMGSMPETPHGWLIG